MALKLLVIKLRAMGDTVLMTSSLETIFAAHPFAAVEVLVPTQWAPLMTDERIRRVWIFDTALRGWPRYRTILELAYMLRAQKYDTVVNLHAGSTSSWLAWASRAPVRAVHFHGHRAKNRFSTVTIPGKGISRTSLQRDHDALAAIGISTEAIPAPVVRVHEKLRHLVDKVRGQFPRPFLGILPGASRETKRWPADRFVRLGALWKAHMGGEPLFLLDPRDKELQTALEDASAQTLKEPIALKTLTFFVSEEVEVLAAHLQGIDLVLTNDSGPKHLAAAVGTPTVTIFGPEDPFEWHPYDREEHPILHLPNLPCRSGAPPGFPPWCGLSQCVVEKHRCMTGITVEEVFAVCKRRYESRRQLTI